MTALARLGVLTDRTCFPSPDHVVACLEFRGILCATAREARPER